MAQIGLEYVKKGYTIVGIPSKDIDECWGTVLPFIERGLEYARECYWAADVCKAVREQDMQLWVLVDKFRTVRGVVVTEIIAYPRRKMVNVFLLAGDDGLSWKDAWFYIEAWSKSVGCDGCTATARPGISRFVKDEGFKTYAHVVGKDYYEPTLH